MKSSGSNLGSTLKKLIDDVVQRAHEYRLTNSLSSNAEVPIDAITSSASGLDPHISYENALLQAARVARARGIPQEKILSLIDQHTQSATLGFLGKRRTNVVLLNHELDKY